MSLPGASDNDMKYRLAFSCGKNVETFSKPLPALDVTVAGTL